TNQRFERRRAIPHGPLHHRVGPLRTSRQQADAGGDPQLPAFLRTGTRSAFRSPRGGGFGQNRFRQLSRCFEGSWSHPQPRRVRVRTQSPLYHCSWSARADQFVSSESTEYVDGETDGEDVDGCISEGSKVGACRRLSPDGGSCGAVKRTAMPRNRSATV